MTESEGLDAELSEEPHVVVAYLVEDVGGKGGATTPNAKQPNSFVYRVLPVDPTDLTKGGSLQALQVINGDHPITFHAGQNDADNTATTSPSKSSRAGSDNRQRQGRRS